jgi:hypothetical protein
VAVTTRGYDNSRTGANLNESILNTGNVNARQFGKLFTRKADGQIYAQPLYLPDVSIPGKGEHNVVYVATQHNSVYAFDADDPAADEPLWHVNLGPSAPVPNSDFGNRFGPYKDIQKEVGITSTPVIDRASGILYTLALLKRGPGSYEHRLYALDVGTGEERIASAKIEGSVPGNGAGSLDGRVIFDSKQQLQRVGLLLSNGVLYFAFAAYADTDPYHGWVFGYDAATLAQVAVFCATPSGGGSGDPDPNGGEGGI